MKNQLFRQEQLPLLSIDQSPVQKKTDNFRIVLCFCMLVNQ